MGRRRENKLANDTHKRRELQFSSSRSAQARRASDTRRLSARSGQIIMSFCYLSPVLLFVLGRSLGTTLFVDLSLSLSLSTRRRHDSSFGLTWAPALLSARLNVSRRSFFVIMSRHRLGRDRWLLVRPLALCVRSIGLHCAWSVYVSVVSLINSSSQSSRISPIANSHARSLARLLASHTTNRTNQYNFQSLI